MDSIVNYSWQIFITLELLSLVALFAFGIIRYFFGKKQWSRLFLVLFLLLLLAEGVLALMIYRWTGEISTVQIVIVVFLVYACTFGIFDFIRLDRWMRMKIGTWRGEELLTTKDYEVMRRNKDAQYIAKKYRISSMIHLVLFIIGQFILWSLGTENVAEMKLYLTDFSWIEQGEAAYSPYANEMSFGIGILWGIVFIVDFVYSWSYTLFPKKENKQS